MLGTKVNRSIVLILILTLSLSLTHTQAHMHAHTAPQLRNMECIRGFLHCTEVADGELTHEYTKMETCTFYQYSHMQNSKTQPNTRVPQASLHLDVRTKQVSTRTRSLSHFAKSNITLSNNSIKYVVGSSQRSSSCTQTQGQSKSFEYRFLLSFLCQ